MPASDAFAGVGALAATDPRAGEIFMQLVQATEMEEASDVVAKLFNLQQTYKQQLLSWDYTHSSDGVCEIRVRWHDIG